ncbi:hypothetical protein [Acinetobacter bereziniae]|uniref:hypothetical protein n=1 Tax=Acinetobacter bereziniae TaxID=106648 RepID=UPI0013CE546E|nr:hypothetical protein [Acinetobacter bereziniae]
MFSNVFISLLVSVISAFVLSIVVIISGLNAGFSKESVWIASVITACNTLSLFILIDYLTFLSKRKDHD